jgi:hypothetical protein
MQKESPPIHVEHNESAVRLPINDYQALPCLMLEQARKEVDPTTLEQNTNEHFELDEKRSSHLNRRLDIRLLPLLCWVSAVEHKQQLLEFLTISDSGLSPKLP